MQMPHQPFVKLLQNSLYCSITQLIIIYSVSLSFTHTHIYNIYQQPCNNKTELFIISILWVLIIISIQKLDHFGYKPV